MKKPRGGWPKHYSDKDIDFGKIATVLIMFGLLSFMTSCHFNGTIKKETFTLNVSQGYTAPLGFGEIEDMSTKPSNIVGPIHVKKRNSVYKVGIKTILPVQSWAYIEGAVLDDEKDYLYSFGKELWHETGRDSEGAWRENKDYYDMKVTFRNAGVYYLQINNESNRTLGNVIIQLTQKRGSSLPHLWFGIFCIIIGIILNEIKNRTLLRISESL